MSSELSWPIIKNYIFLWIKSDPNISDPHPIVSVVDKLLTISPKKNVKSIWK